LSIFSSLFFYLSKVLRPVLTSPLFICFLFCAIALLRLHAKNRLERVFRAVALGHFWEYPLSDVGPFRASGPYDAIVVLGGALDPVSSRPGRIEGNDSFERLVGAAELYRSGVAPLVVASGGTGSLTWPDKKEAPVMAEFLNLMGVPYSVIREESESRNTRENALFSKKLLAKAGVKRFVLVTSAWHMRRSAAIFKKAGLDFSGYSTDSLAGPLELPSDCIPSARALSRSTRLLREMAGFVAYRLAGYL
jgi:uncharacterized SAM-binding protein YcdF (DUF218 family)